MKKHIKKTVVYLIAFTLFSWALMLLALRLALPSLEANKPLVEDLLSEALEVDISIGYINTTWLQNFPTLELSEIIVNELDSDINITRIGNARMRFDILKSILNQRPEFHEIQFSGIEIHIRETQPQTYYVAGIGTFETHSNETVSLKEQTKYGDAITWLLAQKRISVSDSAVMWQAYDNFTLPGFIRKIELQNKGNEHILKGKLFAAFQTTTELNFQLNLQGDLSQLNRLSGQWYIGAKDAKLAEWLKHISFEAVSITDGSVDIDAWGDIHSRTINNAQISFSLTDGKLHNDLIDEDLTIPQLDAHSIITRQDDGLWQIHVMQETLQFNDRIWPGSILAIEVDARTAKNNFKLYTDYLDLPGLQVITNHFPELFSTEAKPDDNFIIHNGTLSDVFIEIYNEGSGFTLLSDIENLSIEEKQTKQAIHNISGQLILNPNDAKLVVMSKNLSLYSKLYQHPIAIRSLDGIFSWQHHDDAWHIVGRDISLANSDTSLTGHFALERRDKVTHLDATFNLGAIDGMRYPYYLPKAEVNPNLYTWLDNSLNTLDIAGGTFVFRGNIEDFPFESNQGSYEFHADINHLDLDYAADWPGIHAASGHLVFTKQRAEIELTKGLLDEVLIQSTHATIANFDKNILIVNSELGGQSEHAVQFLRNSPLAYIVGDDPHDVALEGPFSLNMKLRVPLDDGDTTVNGVANLQNNIFSLPKSNITLSDVTGTLMFDENSVSVNTMNAKFHDEPTSIKIKTLPDGSTVADFTSELDANSLIKTSPNQTPILEGKTTVKVSVHLPKRSDDDSHTSPNIEITSNLKGLAVNVPEPFNKSKDTIKPIRATLNFDKGHLLTDIYLQTMSAKILWQETDTTYVVKQAHVALGQTSPPILQQEGLQISGRTYKISLDEWLDFTSTSQGSNTQLLTPYDIKVSTAHLYMLGEDFQQNNVTYYESPSKSALTFDGDRVTGAITFPLSFADNIDINLQTLQVAPFLKGKSQRKPSESWPAIDFNVEKLIYQSEVLGKVSFKIRPEKSKILFNDLSITSGKSSIAANLEWQQSNTNQSHIIGQLISDDIGNFLKKFEFETGVIDTDANMQFDLTWPGTPFDFNIEAATGNLTLKLEDGRLEDLNPGATRLLGLLSLQSLTRRLSLDFTDLYKKGLSFDTIQGNFKLIKGNAYTCDTMLRSPSTRIQLQGRTGIATRDLQQLATVSLKLSNTVPYIIAAINPIAGAITWVGNRILQDQIDDFTALQYLITGPWDNPDVKPTGTPKALKPWEALPELLPPFAGKSTGNKKPSNIDFIDFCQE